MSRVVLVHGFTQTGRSWDPVAGKLGADVAAPDIEVGADLWDTARRLAAHGPAGYVGYSMGGRLALHLALARPAVVERLVLVSATAGIEDATERAARVADDDARATRIERDGVDAFLSEWLSQPMFAALREAGDRCRDAATLTASLRRLGTGRQEPLWDRLPQLTMPVLVVAGERDTKFVDLAGRLAADIPSAKLTVIPDAGHAVHLERPDAFVDVVAPWLLSH
jgi:2-succinyl-6-hydroxy-2,4-cyclohexadiene-1-carboxylate synthase